MKKSEIIARLKEFNKFAKELFELNFVKKINTSVSIRWKKGDKIKTEFIGPNEEEFFAFCNRIRLFVHVEDTLKIYKLIPIYQSKAINRKDKDFFNKQLSFFERFNKEESNIRLNFKDKQVNLTNFDIFKIFTYGRYTHSSKKTKDKYNYIRDFPTLYEICLQRYVYILHTYLNVINNIVYVNNNVLKTLEK